MPAFRKKPVVIEARPWQGTDTREALDLVRLAAIDGLRSLERGTYGDESYWLGDFTARDFLGPPSEPLALTEIGERFLAAGVDRLASPSQDMSALADALPSSSLPTDGEGDRALQRRLSETLGALWAAGVNAADEATEGNPPERPHEAGRPGAKALIAMVRAHDSSSSSVTHEEWRVVDRDGNAMVVRTFNAAEDLRHEADKNERWGPHRIQRRTVTESDWVDVPAPEGSATWASAQFRSQGSRRERVEGGEDADA